MFFLPENDEKSFFVMLLREVLVELFSLSFFALAIPAVMFAGISKAGFGSGASFASASILALVIAPGQALGLLLPLLMLIDLVSLPSYWRKWRVSDAWLVTIGAIPGVALGAGLYKIADADTIRLLIGGISLGFVAYQVLPLATKTRTRLPKWVGVLSGAGAGFTSFISHAGGPILAVYLLRQGLDKTSYQATTVITFWIMNVLKFALYGWLGLLSFENALMDVALAPFAILGAWLGVRAHRLIPERPFFVITYVLLIVTGTKLIFDGLT